MSHSISRRGLIRGSLGLLALPLGAQAASRPPASLRFRLSETAGLRRFGYPVHIVLDRLPPDFVGKGGLSLQRDGKPVRAQFRQELTAAGNVTVLDFIASPGPLESEEYAVVLGEANESKGGMNVEQRAGVFRVNSGSSLHYDVPDHLARLLKSVGNDAKEYIAPGKADGFVLTGAGWPIDVAPATGSILYQGPLACALRFVTEQKTPGGVGLDVRLHFPSSKSWVEVEVRIDDPKKQVQSCQFGLSLKLDGSPTLVDLGANDTVYGQLKGNESLTLSQAPGRSWKVEMGGGNSLKSFAVSVPDSKTDAEGWAHVMDRQRCTAAAVADFGREHADRIETHADGTMRLHRDFADPSTPLKRFRFWLHFVPMPVQVGAATSPQAMLAPLKATWI